MKYGGFDAMQISYKRQRMRAGRKVLRFSVRQNIAQQQEDKQEKQHTCAVEPLQAQNGIKRLHSWSRLSEFSCDLQINTQSACLSAFQNKSILFLFFFFYIVLFL